MEIELRSSACHSEGPNRYNTDAGRGLARIEIRSRTKWRLDTGKECLWATFCQVRTSCETSGMTQVPAVSSGFESPHKMMLNPDDPHCSEPATVDRESHISSSPSARRTHAVTDRSPRPAMKELITKFETKSPGASLGLGQASTGGESARVARQAWRADRVSVNLELDPSALTSSSLSEDYNSKSLSTGSKPPYAKSSQATLSLNTEAAAATTATVAATTMAAVNTVVSSPATAKSNVTTQFEQTTGGSGSEASAHNSTPLGETNVQGATMYSPQQPRQVQSTPKILQAGGKLAPETVQLENVLRKDPKVVTGHPPIYPPQSDIGQKSDTQTTDLAEQGAPQRVNLREFAFRGNQGPAKDSRYTVHKKDWGKRFGSRQPITNPIAQLLPRATSTPKPEALTPVFSRIECSKVSRGLRSTEPRRAQSAMSSATSRSLSTGCSLYSLKISPKMDRTQQRSTTSTPSNTQQRLHRRNMTRLTDATKGIDSVSHSKSEERKKTAMERYLQFLKRSTPPLPVPPRDAIRVSTQAPGRALSKEAPSRNPEETASTRGAGNEDFGHRRLNESLEEHLETAQVYREEMFPINLSPRDKHGGGSPSLYHPKLGSPLYMSRGKDTEHGETAGVAADKTLVNSPAEQKTKSPQLCRQGSQCSQILEARLPHRTFQSISGHLGQALQQHQHQPQQEHQHHQQQQESAQNALYQKGRRRSPELFPPQVSNINLPAAGAIDSRPATRRSSPSPIAKDKSQRLRREVSKLSSCQGSPYAGSKGPGAGDSSPIKSKSSEHEMSPLHREISDLANQLLTEDELADNDLMPFHLRDPHRRAVQGKSRGKVTTDSFSSDEDSCTVSIEDRLRKIKARRLLKLMKDAESTKQPGVSYSEALGNAALNQRHHEQGTQRCDQLNLRENVNILSQPRDQSQESHSSSKIRSSLSRQRRPKSEPRPNVYSSGAASSHVHKREKIPLLYLQSPSEHDPSAPGSPKKMALADKQHTPLARIATLQPAFEERWDDDLELREPGEKWEDSRRGVSGHEAFDPSPTQWSVSLTQGKSSPSRGNPAASNIETVTETELAGHTGDNSSRRLREPVQREVSIEDLHNHSEVGYHFGMTKPEEEEKNEVQRAAKDSVVRKKRKAEKIKRVKKRKKKMKVEEADLSQTYRTESRNVTEGRRPPHDGSRTRRHGRQQQHSEHRQELCLPHQELDEAGAFHLPGRHRPQSEERTSFRGNHENNKTIVKMPNARSHSLEIATADKSKHSRDTPQDITPTKSQRPGSDYFSSHETPGRLSRHPDDNTYTRSPRRLASPVNFTSRWTPRMFLRSVRIRPVRRLSNLPTARWPIYSHIPLIALEWSPPRKRVDTLMCYRRWREDFMDCVRPSRLPLSQAFKKALDSAVMQEWTMHCWEPVSRLADSTGAWVMRADDQEPFYSASDLSLRPMLPLRPRIQDMKLGPLRVSHVMYLLLGAVSLGLGHLAVTLYNCDGTDVEYFCTEDDATCLAQLAPALLAEQEPGLM
ncbi:uncharacterized protein LOC101853486 isoform X2 [Aplysia californica]|uniref:Uncharacterized protein LOC101853486 isoform X2 n=1 Tax=Aplysia californica TaxID=6500 RepID=A0ABM1A7S2_APLCA|nr:uncharacterized protein LOC101853486 isoform X2 [Aplysia californica]